MDASTWNERYATAEYVWTTEPNQFLPPEVADLPPGRALDLACGEGRNAVWLARKGWTVTGVDFSSAGLDKARALAADQGVEVEWACADATAWVPPAAGFDLVVVFYLQLPADQRRLALQAALTALAPSGTLLLVAHDSANLTDGTAGPRSPEVLYTPADVLDDLAAAGLSFTVERAETVERRVDGADRPALDCLVRVRR